MKSCSPPSHPTTPVSKSAAETSSHGHPYQSEPDCQVGRNRPQESASVLTTWRVQQCGMSHHGTKVNPDVK
eukprot:2983573-Alexandrium_andersonii.AAC.1